MIDEPLLQPQTPRQRPRQWPISLLVVLLLLVAFVLVVIQALRRCGDAVGGQLQWGDLRPLALPGGLFLLGVVLLGVRAIVMSRRPRSETTNRHYGLLSFALLPIFFSIIFTCSQFALMAYPPCSLEVAINPIATADYGAWPYTVFQKVDPRMGTEVALDAFYTPFIPVTVNPVVANFDVPTDPTQIAILTAAATFSIPTAVGGNALLPAEATKAAADTVTQNAMTDATHTAAATLAITATPNSSATVTVMGTLSATPAVTVTGTLTETPVASATVSNPLTDTPAAAATGTAVSAATGTGQATQTVAAALTSTAAGTNTALVTTASPMPLLTTTATTIPVIPTMTPFPTVFVPPPTVPIVPIPTALPTFTPTASRTPVNTNTPTITPTPSNTLTPTATNTPFNLGSIYREYWLSLSNSTAVSALTSSPNYPNSPNGCDLRPSFDAPINWADNYGTRMRGYLYPPTTGLYTFWIASDENGELWLSSDMNPANRALIATVPGNTNLYQWTKYSAQQSAPITLVAGQGYYIDALQKEAGGSDNLSVAWQGPGIPQAIIPGAYLAPYAITCTFIPTATFTLTPSATFTLTPTPTDTLPPTPTDTNTPAPSADVYIAMSVSNPNPNVGDTIQYNIIYGNLGPDMATSVQIISLLPPEVIYVSHSGGSFDPVTGIWGVGNLNGGQSRSISITVMVSPTASGLTISNAASISSAIGDPDMSNNTASASLTVP